MCLWLGLSSLLLVSHPVAGAADQPWSTRRFFCLDERQISLDLNTGFTAAPAVVSELRDEIASAWGLPLGQRVEVCFRGGDRSAVTGVLELLRAPDYPWDPHQALKLGIAGFVFSSREIERWTKT